MNTRQATRTTGRVWRRDANAAGVAVGDGLIITEPVDGGSIHTGLTTWDEGKLKVNARWNGMVSTGTTRFAEFTIRPVLGRRPLFDYRKWSSEADLITPTNMVPRFSYDGLTWTPFSQRTATLSPRTLQFQHHTAFERDCVTVSVASAPLQLVAFRDWWQGKVVRHSSISPTASELRRGSRVVLWTPTRSSVGDACGRVRAAQPLYGVRWQWPGSTPTKLGVITGALHAAGEGSSKWFIKGFLDYLMSGSGEQADTLRSDWVWLIYPSLNPLGEAIGSGRGWGHNTTVDPNRTWDVTTDWFTEQVRAVLTADVAAVSLGAPRVCLDSHTHWDYAHFFMVDDSSGSPGLAFMGAYEVYEPAVTRNNQTMTSQMLASWWLTSGSNRPAALSLIHEVYASSAEDAVAPKGEAFAKAVADINSAL